MRAMRLGLVTLCALLAVTQPASGAAVAIPIGQQDDFEDGTLQNWEGGAILTNVASGGPDGSRYLRVTSDQNGDRHLGAKNQEQWGGRPWVGETTGDYLTHSVTGIAMDVKNFGPETVHLRILLTGHGRWASNDPVILSPGGDWQHVVFGLTEEALTRVEGTEPLANCLADMSRWVFHHDPAPPSGHGGSLEINATIGVDNITAVPEPSALLMLLAGGLLIVWRLRRR